MKYWHIITWIKLENKVKFQYFSHLMQKANSLKKTLMLGKIEGKKRREWQKMRWLDSITNSIDIHFSRLWEIVDDREAWCATAHGVAKGWTRLSNWTTTNAKWNTSFWTTKENASKIGRQHSGWEKIFANDGTDKGSVSKINRQLIQLKKKANNPIKKSRQKKKNVGRWPKYMFLQRRH